MKIKEIEWGAKLADGTRVIENPQIIEVMTIKKKFVDQIRDLNLKVGEKFPEKESIKILGECGQEIIFHIAGNVNLLKATRVDVIQWTIEDWGFTIDEANEFCNQIPQLFSN